MQTQTYHIFMISDSSGETVQNTVKACLGQFPSVENIQEHIFSLIRTDSQINDINLLILEQSKNDNVIVFYSIVNVLLEELLLKDIEKAKILTVPVLQQGITALSKFLKLQPTNRPGKQHLLDEDYFKRINAIEFALMHDDGQSHWNLNEAEIIIIGLSRTSKTPTCMYLANKGVKVANVPFIKETILPKYFDKKTRNPNQLVVGLISNFNNLVAIRQSRLETLSVDNYGFEYTDPIAVREEIRQARKFFKTHDIKVIDVTNRSIEEVSAYILNEYEKYKNG